MKRKVTLLFLGLSFVAAGIGECASLFGPESPMLPNVIGTPLSVDLTNTPAPRGVIGDPVAPSGKTMPPGELTLSYPMK